MFQKIQSTFDERPQTPDISSMSLTNVHNGIDCNIDLSFLLIGFQIDVSYLCKLSCASTKFSGPDNLCSLQCP